MFKGARERVTLLLYKSTIASLSDAKGHNFKDFNFQTPDGIGTSSQIKSLTAGDNFIEDRFPLSPNPEFGLWSVEVSFALNVSFIKKCFC